MKITERNLQELVRDLNVSWGMEFPGSILWYKKINDTYSIGYFFRDNFQNQTYCQFYQLKDTLTIEQVTDFVKKSLVGIFRLTVARILLKPVSRAELVKDLQPVLDRIERKNTVVWPNNPSPGIRH